MNPKLTDQALANLPLQAGRAELLEEIMSTPVTDPVAPERTAPPRRARWLVPLAVAAAVAAVATAPVWWNAPSGEGGDGRDADGAPVAKESAGQTTEKRTEARFRAVLDAPEWRVDNVENDPPYGGISYHNSDANFEVTWYGADSYDSYVEDREHIVDPPAPGAPITVLGLPAQMWAYSANDHTAIREVSAGHWMELRGQGLARDDYLALLGQLRLVSVDEFEAALPARFVTLPEMLTAVDEMLAGIQRVAGDTFPEGAEASLASSDDQDPYHLGAHVTGRVVCAWLDEFKAAKAAADQERMDEAVRVLGTSRQWPVLLEMNTTGDYPEVVWQFADEVAAGQVPEGYRQGLGCP